MARAWVEVPFPYWRHLRNMSAQWGTRLEESKGLLRRTFVFHGTDNQVARAYAEINRLKEISDMRVENK